MTLDSQGFAPWFSTSRVTERSYEVALVEIVNRVD